MMRFALLQCVVHGVLGVPTGYTLRSGTDCACGVDPATDCCQNFRPKVACGIGEQTCDVARLAALCSATAGCEGFNSNGWLKGCLPPLCNASLPGIQHSWVDLYVRDTPAPPTPPPTPPPAPTPSPPAPIPLVDDWHYPAEEFEGDEGAYAYTQVPFATRLEATTNASGTLAFALAASDGTNGTDASKELHVPGDSAAGWTLRCFLTGWQSSADGVSDFESEQVVAVLERDWDRWGIIAFLKLGPGLPEPAWGREQLPRAHAVATTRLLRKGVGNTRHILRPRYNLSEGSGDNGTAYFRDARDDPRDYLWLRARMLANKSGTAGERDASGQDVDAEVRFADFASVLPPSKDYAMLGAVSAHSKFSVAMDGRVRSANYSIFSRMDNGVDSGTAGALLFDPQNFTAYWPATNFSEYKSAFIGRHSRALALAAWDVPASRGFSMLAVPNELRGLSSEPYDTAELFVRLEDADKGTATKYMPRYVAVATCVPLHDADPGDPKCVFPGGRGEGGTGGGRSLRNMRWGTNVRTLGDAGAELYAHLITHTAQWNAMFSVSEDTFTATVSADGTIVDKVTDSAAIVSAGAAMQLRLGAAGREGARLVDMSRSVIAGSLSMWVGDRPNYGDGFHYWSVAQKDRGSLPLESFALDGSLALWGAGDTKLGEAMRRRVGYYLNTYVRSGNGWVPNNRSVAGMAASFGEPGSIDLKHWEDACSFADGLAVYGRWMDLYARLAATDSAWAVSTWPQAVQMVNYTRRLRANATDGDVESAGEVGRGLINGPGEHDTCRDSQRFFHNNLWIWRGWISLSNWLDEEQSDLVHRSDVAELRAVLPDEAAAFKADIDAAVGKSTVVVEGTESYTFLPPWAAANFTPYTSMVETGGYAGGASYANFRYWSEALSSGGLDPALATSVQRFRETHTGTLSGMTRFRDHLDDMPAEGYARAALASDRVPSFHALLFGHTANYQSRGTFNAPEQLSLYGDGGDPSRTTPSSWLYSDSYRAMLSAPDDLDIDFCVPSTTLVAKMVRWMIVFESDRDADELWLLKGAPRRYFRPSIATGADAIPLPWCPATAAMCVSDAPTRFGKVGLVVNVAGNNITAAVRLSLHGRGFVTRPPTRLRIMIRLRDAQGKRRLDPRAIDFTHNPVQATLAGVNSSSEVVAVDVPAAAFATNASFTVRASLQL